MQGLDPEKFTAFNVLEDESLRQGMYIKPDQTTEREKEREILGWEGGGNEMGYVLDSC